MCPGWGPPIDVRPLFANHQAALIDLLRGLGAHEWDRPTICPGWSVKDIAAHVLGDHIGRLSRHRDGHPPPQPRDDETFPAFLDRSNHQWVTATRRISPQLLGPDRCVRQRAPPRGRRLARLHRPWELCD